MTLRVAFDDQIFAIQDYGGISRYFHELAVRISAAADVDLRIFAPVYRSRFLRESRCALQITGAYCPRVPKTDRLMVMLNRTLARPLIRSFRPQVVHETYYPALPTTPAGACSIITVHDMIHEKFPATIPNHDHTARHRASAVARADRIICISHATKQDLVDLLGVDSKKVVVIHHGVSPLGTESPTDAEACPERPYLLYVGQRGGYKNFTRLLQAFAASRLKAECRLVCFGGGAFNREELQAFRNIGLERGQVLHREGSDDVLANLYRHALALVYPSLYEGFGMPPLEAMSSGCPVLCSNTSSLPEVVADAALMFDPGSVEEIRDALERMVDDGGLRLQLIQRGLERSRRFSWDRCAEQTLDVYRSLAG